MAEQSPLVELQFPRMRAERGGGYLYELVHEQGRRMALGVQLALLLLVVRCDS